MIHEDDNKRWQDNIAKGKVVQQDPVVYQHTQLPGLFRIMTHQYVGKPYARFMTFRMCSGGIEFTGFDTGSVNSMHYKEVDDKVAKMLMLSLL